MIGISSHSREFFLNIVKQKIQLLYLLPDSKTEQIWSQYNKTAHSILLLEYAVLCVRSHCAL